MSFEHMACVWKHSRATGPAFTVMLALADYANKYGAAWPSIQTLAKKARCSVSSAKRAVKSGEEDLQELRIEIGAGPHGTNMYHILLATPPHSDTPTPGHADTPAPLTVTPPVTVTPGQPDPKGVSPCVKRGVTVTPDPVKDHSGTRRARGDGPKRPSPSGSSTSADVQKPAGRTRAEIEKELAGETDPEKRRKLANEFMDAE